MPSNIDDARIVLTVAKRGRIVRLDVLTRARGEQSSLTMEFGHWNLELRIPAPEDREPELTPPATGIPTA